MFWKIRKTSMHRYFHRYFCNSNIKTDDYLELLTR